MGEMYNILNRLPENNIYSKWISPVIEFEIL